MTTERVRESARPHVGDLVECAADVREQLDLPAEIGLYLVDRRRDGLVQFVASERAAWLPKRALEQIPTGDPRLDVAPAGLLLVHDIMHLVSATRVELETADSGESLARVGCGGLDPATLRALAARLGEAAPELRIVPGSMSRVDFTFPVGPIAGPRPG